MNLTARLLRRNISVPRIAAFVFSNLVGLAIIVGALQFYEDAGSLWRNDDSFLSSDYLVVNKRVTTSGLWNETQEGFSESEVEDLRSQPWVRDVGEFTSSGYKVLASVAPGNGRGMSTMLFFESVPDGFLDDLPAGWAFREGDTTVPIMISKDYLALYNFGFAGSAGLPQLSEELISTIPLSLELLSDDGSRRINLQGRIAGFSNRLNTILVPESFMEWCNRQLGGEESESPSRLVVNVSSPGDVAISDYLDSHGLEVGGNRAGSSASFLLRLVVGLIVAVGAIISLLSFFLLLLSVSLIMEKNRDKIHTLLMMGVPLGSVAAPYIRIVSAATCVAFLLAIGVGIALRMWYLEPLRALGATGGNVVIAPAVALAVSLLLLSLNVVSIRRKVRKSWR